MTSLTIFAFSFGDSVVNHFARRCVRVSDGWAWRREDTCFQGHAQLCPASTAGSDTWRVVRRVEVMFPGGRSSYRTAIVMVGVQGLWGWQAR